MPNPLCHFEIGCRDQEKAVNFYTRLFDWKHEQKGDQAMLRTGADVGGHVEGKKPANYVVFYVMVDDVPASVRKSIELGGKQVLAPTGIPGGDYAWIADPEGNVIGLYQNKQA